MFTIAHSVFNQAVFKNVVNSTIKSPVPHANPSRFIPTIDIHSSELKLKFPILSMFKLFLCLKMHISVPYTFNFIPIRKFSANFINLYSMHIKVRCILEYGTNFESSCNVPPQRIEMVVLFVNISNKAMYCVAIKKC